MVLVGWHFNLPLLKTVIPGLISMKSNTAMGLACLSLAGIALNQKSVLPWRRTVGTLLGVFVTVLAVSSLCEYIFHLNLGIDEFFYLDPDAMKTRWPPGRPAPVTLISFILISLAIFLDQLQSKRNRKLQQALLLIAWVISFQAFIGYLVGVTYSFGSAFYTQIAIHTAGSFILITSGFLLSRSNAGFMASILNSNLSGKVGRKLIVSAVVVPPLINWAQTRGVALSWWDEDFGVLLRVVGNVMFFAWIAFQTSTQLMMAEVERNAALVKLEAAVKARDDLLSICSHELRTPIASMKLASQTYRRGLQKSDPRATSPERIVKMVEQSDRQLDRLINLIDEMLDFSHVNRGSLKLQITNFNLSELVGEIVERMRPQFQALQADLIFQPAPAIEGGWDRFRIEQVIVNLFSNALKYGAYQPVRVSLVDLGSATQLKVSDQGLGIAPADQQRIFQAYERAVNLQNISGLGLGLYLSKQIVEAHQGSIEVFSALGMGSSFVVNLPKQAGFRSQSV